MLTTNTSLFMSPVKFDYIKAAFIIKQYTISNSIVGLKLMQLFEIKVQLNDGSRSGFLENFDNQ